MKWSELYGTDEPLSFKGRGMLPKKKKKKVTGIPEGVEPRLLPSTPDDVKGIVPGKVKRGRGSVRGVR